MIRHPVPVRHVPGQTIIRLLFLRTSTANYLCKSLLWLRFLLWSQSCSTGGIIMVRDLNGHSTETLPVLASHKPICAIDSLCDDVLLSIFLFFHHASLACYDVRAYDCLSTARSPWVLSHVCHNWRALVVSFPLLWTNIYIDTDNYIYHPSNRALALETVLQRSGDLVLDVQIEDAQQQAEPDFTRKQVEEVRACGRSLVCLLLPTTGRWRHLTISSSCDSTLR